MCNAFSYDEKHLKCTFWESLTSKPKDRLRALAAPAASTASTAQTSQVTPAAQADSTGLRALSASPASSDYDDFCTSINDDSNECRSNTVTTSTRKTSSTFIEELKYDW